METDKKVTPEEAIHNAENFEECLAESVVKLIFKQKRGANERICEAFIEVCHSTKAEELVQYLRDEGYDQGPLPSNEMCMKEGQRLQFSFTGNLAFEDEQQFRRFPFRKNFNSTRNEFFIKPKNPFGNNGREFYNGKGILYALKLNPGSEIEGEPLCTMPAKLNKVCVRC